MFQLLRVHCLVDESILNSSYSCTLWSVLHGNSWHLLAGWFIQKVSPNIFKTVNISDFSVNPGCLNAAQCCPTSSWAVDDPCRTGTRVPREGVTWNNRQNWRLLDFQGTWVFVVFSLVVANFCRTRRKMALHGLMEDYIIAPTVWGMVSSALGKGQAFGGKFGPSITVWEGKILWEDVLCFIGWPERPLKVIPLARILDKWWLLQRDLWFLLLFQYPPTVDAAWMLTLTSIENLKIGWKRFGIQPYQTLPGKPAEVVFKWKAA